MAHASFPTVGRRWLALIGLGILLSCLCGLGGVSSLGVSGEFLSIDLGDEATILLMPAGWLRPSAAPLHEIHFGLPHGRPICVQEPGPILPLGVVQFGFWHWRC